MPLSNRMLLGAGALALGLAGAAAWSLFGPMSASDIAETIVLGPDGEPIDPFGEAARERDERRANSRNLGSMQRRDQDAANAEAGTPDPDPGGPIDAEAASRGFEIAMTEVERTADRRKKLDREEWDELYRTANDAFAALSMQLDATDPAERDELEQAHARLVEGLRRVRVRGNKKLVD
jgi:hypothetical protein